MCTVNTQMIVAPLFSSIQSEGGRLCFLSPCVLPMAPAYLVRLAGLSVVFVALGIPWLYRTYQFEFGSSSASSGAEPS